MSDDISAVHVRHEADDLRDLDLLRLALDELTNKELGAVLGVTLSKLDDRGDSPLPDLLRALANEVEAMA